MQSPRLKSSTVVRILCLAVCTFGALVGGSASASASDASIKAVIKSYDSRILVAEGHVVTAIGEYKKSGNPSGVQAAITKSTSVLRSLRSAIAKQSADNSKVKQAKTKIEQGLHALILAYQHLKTAFGEKHANPQSARAQAKTALAALKSGGKELREGARLLR